MTQWDKLLKSLGFTESEAKVYLASLELGPAAVQALAKKAAVARVTAYSATESLLTKGLMSSSEKGKKTLYAVESPERLISFVQSRVKSMEATLGEIQSGLGELKLIQRGEKPVVKLFEGREALKAIQDDMLAARPKFIDELGNLDQLHKIYSSEELEPYFAKLERLKPKRRLIWLSSESGPDQRIEKPLLRRMVLPKEKYSFNGDVLVYGNKVALSTFSGRQISVLIESQDLAETVRAMFDYIWNAQKK